MQFNYIPINLRSWIEDLDRSLDQAVSSEKLALKTWSCSFSLDHSENTLHLVPAIKARPVLIFLFTHGGNY